MLCPVCHHANDNHARFCEQCGQPCNLYCPACNAPSRPGARFCSHCGQSLALHPAATPAPTAPVARSSSLDEKLAQLQGYLPSHLADKILANRGRLQGERKLVTVLFTDVTGYTTLSEQLGEEALFTLMDDLYELFIHEIHRYEGTVNELTGDGIVAFFGAPLAVEQAPQRAVRAALALQEAVAQYSARLERERGMRLQVRVGINTGPVVVGTVGNNLRMDYKAVGNTVNLAARMEQTAAPGMIQITAQTYRLVAGYFDCEDLGLVGVKGITSKVRAYRVTGERRAQARIDVARERGFTRLVGREQELHLLCEGFARAKEEYGQAISIIGDAGLGKSRLLYEFRQTLADEEFTLLEGRCSPYGAAVAYLPIIELLKQNFQIAPSDTDTDIQAKVLRGTEALGADVAAIVPYLLRLLAAEAENSIPPTLAPEMVKRKTCEALQMLMLKEAARRPLILTIEDLHWVDKTTEECLTFLEAIRKPTSNVVPISSRILAVMKGRTSAWREPIKHKLHITDLDHSRTRFDTTLIVLTVTPIPPIPRVCALNYPAFLQRREAFHPLWTRRHLDAPPGPMHGHPSVQGMVVILLIRKDRHETGKVLGRDVAEQERSRHPIVETRTGNEDSQHQAQRIDQQMPLAPFDFLAPIIPTRGAPDLRGLDRLAIDARGTRGRLAPRCYAGSFTQGLHDLGPGPVVAPLRKVIIDRALGQQIMRQHVPLTTAPVQIKKRIEDFSHVDLTRVPSAWTRLGRRDQRCHDSPLLVRQV